MHPEAIPVEYLPDPQRTQPAAFAVAVLAADLPGPHSVHETLGAAASE